MPCTIVWDDYGKKKFYIINLKNYGNLVEMIHRLNDLISSINLFQLIDKLYPSRHKTSSFILIISSSPP